MWLEQDVQLLDWYWGRGQLGLILQTISHQLFVVAVRCYIWCRFFEPKQVARVRTPSGSAVHTLIRPRSGVAESISYGLSPDWDVRHEQVCAATATNIRTHLANSCPSHGRSEHGWAYAANRLTMAVVQSLQHCRTVVYRTFRALLN